MTTSPAPRAAGSTRLAELAGPTRGRPRYAPLTAGLLARKGEAQPASPLFAAEALGLSPQLTTGSRPQLPPPAEIELAAGAAEEPEPDIREALRPWRSRKVEPEPNGFDHAAEAKAQPRPHPHPHHHPQAPSSEPAAHQRLPREAERDGRAALTLDLDLETLARLVLEARKRSSSPARLVEQALAAHLPASGACPLCDAFHVAP